jgi:hypothetical protein
LSAICLVVLAPRREGVIDVAECQLGEGIRGCKGGKGAVRHLIALGPWPCRLRLRPRILFPPYRKTLEQIAAGERREGAAFMFCRHNASEGTIEALVRAPKVPGVVNAPHHPVNLFQPVIHSYTHPAQTCSIQVRQLKWERVSR